MSIRIVTDSTADIPVEVAQKHNITVIPAYINIGDKSYLDGIDMSRKEFYELLPTLPEVPTTATPGVAIFTDLYEQLAKEGATEIISIHLSSTLSALYNTARLGAEDAKSARVITVDSKQVSLGIGLLAIQASQLAANGSSVEEILTVLETLKPRTYVIAALDTLEYLRRSGRVSRFQSVFGTMLQVKPIIVVHEGDLGLERTRTRKGAVDRLLALMQELGPHDQIAVLHTHTPNRAQELRQQIEQLFPSNPAELMTEVTPIIGTHVGPETVAVAIVQSQKK
jgi:DegV family protein with EDD domain